MLSEVVAEEGGVCRGTRDVCGDPQECGIKKEEFAVVGRLYSTKCREESRKVRTERWDLGIYDLCL